MVKKNKGQEQPGHADERPVGYDYAALLEAARQETADPELVRATIAMLEANNYDYTEGIDFAEIAVIVTALLATGDAPAAIVGVIMEAAAGGCAG